MECKVQKHPVIVFNDEGGSSDKDGTCTSCSRCGSKFLTWTYLVLLLVLFLSNISLHYKCMTLSNELSELQKRDISPRASHHSSSNQDSTSASTHHNYERSLSKRNSHQGRRRRREIISNLESTTQRHKDAIERILNRPAMHLRGSSTYVMQTAWNIILSSYRGQIFVWEHQDPNEPNPAFRYVNDVQDSTKIMGINITNPGMYLIYCQVMINGPFKNFDPAYGLETVRVKPSNHYEEVLLRSHVTQDGRGSVYPNVPNYPPQYPVDFISQMGMFELECDDIIYVRVPNHSDNGNYLTSAEQTYFGLELLRPKYNYLERLNGC